MPERSALRLEMRLPSGVLGPPLYWRRSSTTRLISEMRHVTGVLASSGPAAGGALGSMWSYMVVDFVKVARASRRDRPEAYPTFTAGWSEDKANVGVSGFRMSAKYF